MRRYELTDEQYELIGDLLPGNGKRGGQWNDHRTTLNGMFWILHWVLNGARCPNVTADGKASTTASTAGERTERLIESSSGCR